jgi:hypothetical protein
MNDLDNELTPIAEFAWKMYSQLLRAGFERLDALHVVVAMLREMVANNRATPK